MWKEHGACPVTITHGTVEVSDYNIVQLDFCSKANCTQRSTRIIVNWSDTKFISTSHCSSYNVEICDSSSDQTTCIISEHTTSSPTSNTSAELTPLSLTSLPLATSSQLPEPSEIISLLSASQSLPPSPSLPSIVNSPVSISDSSDFSLVGIQSSSATLSLPTSMLSSASQLDSFSIQATSSMPATSVLSSASQIDSTSLMHILSSIPHSSNSGHTPLSLTTMPAVTSIVAATSSSHFNSASPSHSPLINCPGTNQWKSTKPGQWANGTCHKGIFNG